MEAEQAESYASVRCHAKVLKKQFKVWVKRGEAQGMNGVHAYVNGLASNTHVLDVMAKLEPRSEMQKQMNAYGFVWIAVTKDSRAPFGELTAKEERARTYLRTWRTYQVWLDDPNVTIHAKSRKRLTTARLHEIYYDVIEKQ